MKVDVQNIVRHFGQTKAVDDVSFSFSGGNVFGFVGPNGAGKTTTLRILATLDEPTQGDVLMDGVSVKEEPEKVRRLVGYVPDALPAHGDTTVHEYLDFFARSYGLRGRRRCDAVDAVEEFTSLTGIRDKVLRALSKGMKQRVSLGRALIHDPEVLIMDEPAAGLDPRARVEFRELVSILAEQDKAILISSHILTELTEICNGVVIIERGKLIETGSIEEVTQRDGVVRTMVVRAMKGGEDLYKAALEMPHVDAVRLAGDAIHVDMRDGDEACHELLATMLQRGIKVIEFRPLRGDLEDVFMRVTQGEVQ